MEAKALKDQDRHECREFIETQLRSLARKTGKQVDVRILTQDVLELIDDSCKYITPQDVDKVCNNVLKGVYGDLNEIKLISASFFKWFDAIQVKPQKVKKTGINKSDIGNYLITIRSEEHKKAVKASLRKGVIDENCYYSFDEIKQLDPEFGAKWDDLVKKSETAFKPDYFESFENKYADQLAEFEDI